MRAGLKILLLFIIVSVALSVQASAQTYEFTNCGAEGRTGPSQSQCDSAYGQEGPNVNIVGEGIQEWTVPETGIYNITAYGAEGSDLDSAARGEGAVISGKLELDNSDVLHILAGQKSDYVGNRDWFGGSGGSFVVKEMGDTPLVIAGGGAGGRSESTYNSIARANTGTCGKGGTGTSGGCNGKAAEYGGHNLEGGAQAAGFIETGDPDQDLRKSGGEDPFEPAKSWEDGMTGGEFYTEYDENGEWNNGGFGGAAPGGWGGTGGGGGYSGGGNDDNGGWAGGGGSFIHADAEDPATSDGNWDTTGSEPHEVYTGSVGDLNQWNEGPGYVTIELIESGDVDFCNFRGPVDECVMNRTNELNDRQYNVSSIFVARSNAVFEAFNGPATLNLSNSSRISGLWRGAFRIETEKPRIQAGASFRPQGERIVIGEGY